MLQKHAFSPRLIPLIALLLAALFLCGCDAARLLLEIPAPSPEATAFIEPERSAAPIASPEELLKSYAAERFSEGCVSTVYADLTHDGQAELIAVELLSAEGSEPLKMARTVYTKKEISSIRVTVYAARDGAVNAIYTRSVKPNAESVHLALYSGNGEDYLFEYVRSLEDGNATLRYAMFSFTEEGETLEKLSKGFYFYYVDYGYGAYVLDANRNDATEAYLTYEEGAWDYLRGATLLASLSEDPFTDIRFSYLGRPAAGAGALLTPEADYDGDGAADAAELVCGDARAVLTVTLSTGKTLTAEFEGEREGAYALTAGDVDGDGCDELAVSLGYFFAGGMDASLSVFKVAGGGLAPLTKELAKNPALSLSQPASFDGKEAVVVGGGIIEQEDRMVLRVKYCDTQATEIVRYVDARMENGVWKTVNAGFSYAMRGTFCEAVLPLAVPSYPSRDAKRRAGYAAPKISFSFGSPGAEGNPYERTYDADITLQRLSCEELASEALRDLYDLSGYLPDTVYATVYGLPRVCSITFSLTEGGASFYSVSMGELYGFSDIGNLYVVYSDMQGSSPISTSADAFLKPDTALGREEAAQWYYDRLCFGDGRKVMKTSVPYKDCVRLIFADGGFVEAYFSDGSNVPDSFYGPYPEGAEH